jgi:hypothetical protein
VKNSYLIIPIITISLFLFNSCESNVKETQLKDRYIGSIFTVIEVVSCEYIYHNSDIRTMSHKGNCKYCQVRLIKILNNLNK